MSRCPIAGSATGSSSVTGPAGLIHQGLQVVRRHRPVAHPSPIGPPAVDRPEQGGVGGVGATGSDRDGGEVAAVLGVGHAAHLHRQAAGGERDLQVVQGGAAAEDQIAAVRVGRDEMPVPVGVQLHGVGADPPAPGLGVVDRRRAQRVLDRCGEIRWSGSWWPPGPASSVTAVRIGIDPGGREPRAEALVLGAGPFDRAVTPEDQEKALTPVMSRPTSRVWMCSVPS